MLQDDLAFGFSGEVGGDFDLVVPETDHGGGGCQVLGLLAFDGPGAGGPEVFVERAAVVGDEDDLAKVVFADEEGELFFEGGLLPER